MVVPTALPQALAGIVGPHRVQLGSMGWQGCAAASQVACMEASRALGPPLMAALRADRPVARVCLGKLM